MWGIRRDLPNNEWLAATNAASPSALNPFATINDLSGFVNSNIYTADGSTTGNRTLTGDESLLLFTNTNFRAITGDAAYLEATGDSVNLEGGGGVNVKSQLKLNAAASAVQTIRFQDLGATAFDGLLQNPDLTAARTWTFQDASGTIAHLSDIPAPDGNGIYSGSDSLTVDTVVTMGENNLHFALESPPDGASGKFVVAPDSQVIDGTIPYIFFRSPNASPVTVWGFNGSDLTSAFRVANSAGNIVAVDFYNDGDTAFGVTGAALTRGRVSIGINAPISGDAKFTVKSIDTATGNIIAHFIDSANSTALQVQADRRVGVVSMGATDTRFNVRALATDTEIAGLQDDLGGNKFLFRRDGLMQIDTTATQVSGIEMYSIVSEKSTSANEIHGSAGFVHRFNPTVNGSGRTSAVYGNAIKEGAFNSTESQGGFFQSSNTGTGNITNNRGLVAQAINSGNATITRQYALEANVQTTGTGTFTDFGGIRVRREQAALGATITNFYGIKIDTPTNTGATVTNTFGIQIDPCTIGSTNYGIRQQGASMTNAFEGGTSIGVVGGPGSGKLLVHGAGTGTGTNVTFEDDSANDKWVWRDNGQVYSHAGATATPQATMGQYHQSTNFNFGFAIYGRTGTAVSLFTVNASNGAGARVIDAQFQGNPTGEATSVRGLSWQPTSTTNIGIQGTARSGIQYAIGVDGVSAGGWGTAATQYAAGVRGTTSNNVDNLMYGGYFSAQTNNGSETFTKDIIGVFGVANPQSGTANTSDAYGGIFTAQGSGGTGNRYGVKATATGGTRDNIAIWTEAGDGEWILGAAGVSATNPGLLEVTGDIKILNSANGLILESATKTWRVTIDDFGSLVTTEL